MLVQNKFLRQIVFIFGLLCLFLGAIGVIVPLLPTVPFFILAAFLFTKSSPCLRQWLMTRPYLGPVILDWENHRVIPKKAKWLSTASIVIGFSILFYFVMLNKMQQIILIGIALSVTTFIWLQCSEKPHNPSEK